MIKNVANSYRSKVSLELLKQVLSIVVSLKLSKSTVDSVTVENHLKRVGIIATHYQVLCCLRYMVYSGFRFAHLDYTKPHHYL